ncbi:BTB/POZ domain-containing protein KCTD7-like [Physella acuta]|uniref:BTB/POZ domain-containing protein KCTD7-like n=1 Tax=Physella acuta TaxID=109671 RepID=UPI0027DC9EC1|nr:BTB/POZ domain-containing protein KCTD7-like [Physella acuta]XP_059169233.1 BTB/POZ domain-containing protein KCTD7-like [Physella acuta]XP_059169234.1 BTB/POZ domain-containing protein KCTD7-like [Physella acuta]XP_059169235.1 BTB/POZ domain-containing protein KCTD7-like [Physella acuta]
MEDNQSNSNDEESDQMEEIITVRPIPTPRLQAFQNQHYILGDWTKQSHDGILFKTKENGPELSPQSLFPPIIPLNVGGHLYMTRLSTLLKFPDSMLAAMFSGRHKIDKDKDGNFFLDSNGIVFEYILEYLRYGTLPPNDKMTYLIFRDANYYGLHDLVEKLQLKPEIASLAVKQAQRAQFPEYEIVKEQVIKAAMSRASIARMGDVYIYAFRKELKSKFSALNQKHGCIVETAHVTVGPWEAPADEDTLIRCLENDLIEEGYNLRPHEGKKKCKYFGQSCHKFIFKVSIIFD